MCFIKYLATIAAILVISFTLGDSFEARASEPVKRLPDGVTPTRYHLDLHVDPRQDRFSGIARIDLQLSKPTKTIHLHGRNLNVREVSATGPGGNPVPATYTEDGETGNATLELTQAIGPGDVTLEFKYDAGFNDSYVGLYKVERDGISYAYTHFEPLAARRMFPGFDEPRFKTRFEIDVTVSAEDRAVSNAPEKTATRLADGRKRISFQQTEPIPTYLVALAVGDFDIVEWQAIPTNSVRSRPVPLRGITAKGNGRKIEYALKHTAAMMAILEDYFSVPYPYAKLDLIAAAGFNSAGMENVGAIMYREDRILMGDDRSIYQERGYAGLHAHELAHMWFGNYVTPAWWDDLWLNEAFATWMSSKVAHAWRPDMFSDRGPIRAANRAKWTDRRATARKIHNPIDSEEDISLAFDDITYSKGGGVLSMIEHYVGPEVFRAGLRRYVRRYGHGVATTENFFATIAESANNPGLLAAFKSFVEQPGTPLVAVDWTCDATGAATVSLRQSRSLPLGSSGQRDTRWTIPLCLAWNENSTRMSQCTLLKEPITKLRLASASCPSAILPNRDGAAYINFELPQKGWDSLISTIGDLPPGEALAMLRSLQSAYEAGQVDTKTIIAASKEAAKSAHWDVVEAPMQNLRHLKLFVVPKSQRNTILSLLQDLYRPQLANIDTSDSALAGTPEEVSAALSRSTLFWFLAIDAEEPELGRVLTRRAHALLGYNSDKEFHPDVLHPNLHRTVLYVALQTTGLPFAETMIHHMKTTRSAALRQHIVRALAHSTDPQIINRVWSLILDPEISKYDAGQLLRSQSQKVDNAAALFDWMISNYDAILQRIPRSHHRWMPWRASSFCDSAHRSRVEAFFSTPAKLKASGPKVLQSVLEHIDLCIAFAQAQRPGALDAIADFKP